MNRRGRHSGLWKLVLLSLAFLVCGLLAIAVALNATGLGYPPLTGAYLAGSGLSLLVAAALLGAAAWRDPYAPPARDPLAARLRRR